jgi:hypothetical protein
MNRLAGAALLISTLFLAPSLRADCGCAGGSASPCVQDAFAMEPVVALAPKVHERSTAMDLSIMHCWDCSSYDLTGSLLLAVPLFLLLLLADRVMYTPLIVLRLDRVSRGVPVQRRHSPWSGGSLTRRLISCAS